MVFKGMTDDRFRAPCLILAAAVFFALASADRASAEAPPPVIIGLDADMSSGSAESGQAIRRGIELAMARINAGGGVLGRPLSLIVRDHHGNPTRGIDNIEELARMKNLLAVVGGLHTPVAMAELPAIHRHGLIYLGPWAAGTGIVDNGYVPNFVFRVSVKDAHAGGYLIGQAIRRGFQRPALLLEKTAWGRSNEKAMLAALAESRLTPATVQWFLWGTGSVQQQLKAVGRAGADVVILVANAPEGAVVVKAMAALGPEARLPVISHWGVTGGDFFFEAKEDLTATDFTVLQTFSFLSPGRAAAARTVAQSYLARYPEHLSTADIRSPVGVAHAYDLVGMLAAAVEQAGTTERPAVRDALERLGRYEGLVRIYDPPFTPDRHDALTAADFHMARFDPNGVIRRVSEP